MTELPKTIKMGISINTGSALFNAGNQDSQNLGGDTKAQVSLLLKNASPNYKSWN